MISTFTESQQKFQFHATADHGYMYVCVCEYFLSSKEVCAYPVALSVSTVLRSTILYCVTEYAANFLKHPSINWFLFPDDTLPYEKVCQYHAHN